MFRSKLFRCRLSSLFTAGLIDSFHMWSDVVHVRLQIIVYALTAWLSLYFPVAASYLELLREIYLCLTVSSFFNFLVAFMGGEEQLSNYLFEKREAIGLFGRRVLLDDSYLQFTKLCVIQYVVVRLILAVIAFILQVAAPPSYLLYSIQSSSGYIYLQVIHLLSQILILYQLASFVRISPSAPFRVASFRACKRIWSSLTPAFRANRLPCFVCILS